MRPSLSMLASLLLAASIPVAAHADPLVYDANSSFSTSSSTAPFAYGFSTPGDGGFTVDTVTGNYTQPGYTGSYPYVSAPGFLPVVGQGNSSGPIGSVNVPAGLLWMHPGNSATEASIVQFTAPVSGTYNLSGLFQRDDTTDGAYNGVDVYIYVDQTGAPIFSSYIASTLYGTDANFNQNVTLTAGQTVDFEVGINTAVANPVYYNDSTGFEAVITQTPEPSSLLLFGTGILGVAGAVRRRLVRS